MAHFYAEIQGNRGEATRMGTAKSGMRCHIRGWNIGIQVQIYQDKNGNDVVEVYHTDGSNGWHSELIAKITEGEE